MRRLEGVMKRAWAVAVALVMVAAMGVSWSASAAEDDLAVVKRAVAVQTIDDDPDVRPAAPSAARSDVRGSDVRKASRRATWLKVRIVEAKDGKKEDRVSVTLPLALFAALGKDATVDLSELGVRGLKDNQRNLRVMDVLESLEPGSLLVEVKDENAHVRVWVE
jgi:hypothetical protein